MNGFFLGIEKRIKNRTEGGSTRIRKSHAEVQQRPLPQWESYYEPRADSGVHFDEARTDIIRRETNPILIQRREKREVQRLARKEKQMREERIKQLRAKRFALKRRIQDRKLQMRVWEEYENERDREMHSLVKKAELFIASSAVLGAFAGVGALVLSFESLLASAQGFIASAPAALGELSSKMLFALAHTDPTLVTALAGVTLPLMLAMRNAAVSARKLKQLRAENRY